MDLKTAGSDGASEMTNLTRECIERFLEKNLGPGLAAFKGKMEMASKGWLSIENAAMYADVSPDHIRRAVRGAMLPASNVGTPDRPLYRISRQDLDAWLEKRKAGALPPPRKKKKAPSVTSLPPSRHLRASTSL